MSALKKNCFHLRGDNCCAFASNFDMIFCICFKAGDQKMRPCAFIFFSMQSCRVGWSASEAKKVIKDGCHQGK